MRTKKSQYLTHLFSIERGYPIRIIKKFNIHKKGIKRGLDNPSNETPNKEAENTKGGLSHLLQVTPTGNVTGRDDIPVKVFTSARDRTGFLLYSKPASFMGEYAWYYIPHTMVPRP